MFDVDVPTILAALRNNGHTVEHATPLPNNAGGYEFVVDGAPLTLEQVRALLESEAAK